MKAYIKPFLRYFPLVLCMGLFVMAYFYLRDSTVGQANTLKRSARKAYYAHEFLKAADTYRFLVDSLHEQNDAVSINYANAAFLSSDIPMDPTDSRLKAKAPAPETPADSTKPKPPVYADVSAMEYSKLASSGRTAFASMASNQLGVSGIKTAEKKDNPAALDSALRQALNNFKEALLKDPANDSARYNYELVKKLVEYPEHVVNQVKALVEKRRYKEAVGLLETAMQRDKRLKQQQQELLKRIKTIVSIDSLDTKTTL